MKSFSLLLGLAAVSLFTIGCDQPTVEKVGTTGTHKEDDPHAGHNHGDDDHDHAAHDHSPKHGGHLIEIGPNHGYHAELVDDHQTESITIDMMDNHMGPLTIDDSSISLVLTAGDKTETFELLGTQPGGSASFSSSDATLMSMIAAKESKGSVHVKIDGTPFSGTFEHHGHDRSKGSDSHGGHNH